MYAPNITTGDGTNRQFAVPFPYINKSHVYVEVNDVAVTYAWLSASMLETTVPPGAGTTVVVKRITPADAPMVVVADGIVPLGKDFNLQALQTLFVSQEASYASGAIEGTVTQAVAESLNNAQDADAARVLAEAALAATLSAFDNFDDRYLGVKAADPTQDNDGNALVGGQLYFNSVSQIMKVFTGTVWVAAYVDGAGVLLRTGGTMTGPIVLDADASNALHPTTKQQVDAALAGKSNTGHTHPANDISDASTAGKNLLTAANLADQRTVLGLGTAALLDVGVTANKVVQLDGAAKLPALNASQLTNVKPDVLIENITIGSTQTDIVFATIANPTLYRELYVTGGCSLAGATAFNIMVSGDGGATYSAAIFTATNGVAATTYYVYFSIDLKSGTGPYPCVFGVKSEAGVQLVGEFKVTSQGVLTSGHYPINRIKVTGVSFDIASLSLYGVLK